MMRLSGIRKLKISMLSMLLVFCMLPWQTCFAAGVQIAGEVQETEAPESAQNEDAAEADAEDEEDASQEETGDGETAAVSVSQDETGLRDLTGSAEWPAAPAELSAASIFLFEKRSGEILYARDPDAISFPASTTKIMTALLTLENCDLNEEVTFSHDAIYDIEEGGHHYEFEEGEVLTVDECLQFLLVESVNEVGYALAEHIGGSLEGFAEMMNKRAKELGCKNTNFVNPHGLNDPEHVTTARDMALILSECVENEDFKKYASQTSVRLAGRAIRTEGFSTYTNHHLMLQPESEYYDPDVVCGKTGFTSLAGNTLVTYAEKEGKEVICVLMQGLSDRFNDTKLLLDYAFSDFRLVTQENAAETFPDLYDKIGRAAEDIEMPDLAVMIPDLADEEKLSVSFEPSDAALTEDNRTLGKVSLFIDQAEAGSADVLLTEDALEAYLESKADESIAAAESAAAAEEEAYVPEQEYFGWTISELIFLAVLGVLLIILLSLFFYLLGQRIRWNREARRRGRRRRR